ncbi:telomere-binding alpha subunit central domain-containing protein [Colletotrichum incanum]|uniref:Protection of telomeres protein 1 n=1 Tax=Colletotrichum incanum TaxID=1573173 RepID=A0A167D3S1_COLIC|nr:telomere-binding alpha subunit central domain-containing protein [Colletotrichum incanum]
MPQLTRLIDSVSMALPDAGTVMDLPQGFTSIANLLDEKVEANSLVNIIGIAVDFQKPIPTKGADHKATIRLFDFSVSGEYRDIEMVLFRPETAMPDVGAGDIVAVYQAKCQRYRSNPMSLITNHSTAIHVYPAAKIPPSPAQAASCPLMLSTKDSGHKPAPKDEQYMSWLFYNIDKSYIPDVEQFNIQATRSLNVKNKLCELKDAKDGTFHDIIVQVVQEPHDYGDKIRLYVSDYTENSGFFNYMRTGQAGENSRDGDPYGYTSGKASTSSNWNGPFGKKSLQVTCWEPHATVIRQRVHIGSWVHLLNIQFKFGSNGQNLEGYLRQDQNAFPNKVYVDVLDPSEDPEHMHPSMKNAIRRKRDCEKEEKAERKGLQSTQATSKKRPAADQPEDKRLNSKQRRAMQRAQAEEKAKQDEAPAEANLNKQVVAEHPEQATVPVSVILEPAKYETTYQGAPFLLDLPFNCAKYRTNVRVIDFHPNRLQDFARARKQTEYDVLSDYSGVESESEEEEGGTLDGYVKTSDRIWEWRFALRLQDVTAVAKNPKNRKENSFWVVVGNMDAQLLTNMDACDLRVNPNELARLREKMFILWGDLEEKKTKELANKSKKQKATAGKKMASDRPPDSSDNEGPNGPSKKEAEAISNRPFTCCIHQYGIRVKESNPDKANAGEGKRWKRMFGLIGTKICQK